MGDWMFTVHRIMSVRPMNPPVTTIAQQSNTTRHLVEYCMLWRLRFCTKNAELLVHSEDSQWFGGGFDWFIIHQRGHWFLAEFFPGLRSAFVPQSLVALLPSCDLDPGSLWCFWTRNFYQWSPKVKTLWWMERSYLWSFVSNCRLLNPLRKRSRKLVSRGCMQNGKQQAVQELPQFSQIQALRKQRKTTGTVMSLWTRAMRCVCTMTDQTCNSGRARYGPCRGPAIITPEPRYETCGRDLFGCFAEHWCAQTKRLSAQTSLSRWRKAPHLTQQSRVDWIICLKIEWRSHTRPETTFWQEQTNQRIPLEGTKTHNPSVFSQELCLELNRFLSALSLPAAFCWTEGFVQ